MAQGRGSASGAVALATLLLFFVAHIETVHAAVYTVGGGSGWTFSVVNWPRGKKFRAGDQLIFKYSPSAHNVVLVDGKGYGSCASPRGAKSFQTGNDRITLKKGPNFFICSLPGHCEGGMKIAVNAA